MDALGLLLGKAPWLTRRRDWFAQPTASRGAHRLPPEFSTHCVVGLGDVGHRAWLYRRILVRERPPSGDAGCRENKRLTHDLRRTCISLEPNYDVKMDKIKIDPPIG